MSISENQLANVDGNATFEFFQSGWFDVYLLCVCGGGTNVVHFMISCRFIFAPQRGHLHHFLSMGEEKPDTLDFVKDFQEYLSQQTQHVNMISGSVSGVKEADELPPGN